MPLEKLALINDIGPVVISSVSNFFKTRENLELTERLLNEISVKKEVVNKKGVFAGKNIVFTGTLKTLKRALAQELVQKNGGTCSGIINKKTDLCIVGEKAGTKAEVAQKMKIKVITENEFLAMMIKIFGERKMMIRKAVFPVAGLGTRFCLQQLSKRDVTGRG